MTMASSVKGRNLQADPRVAISVDGEKFPFASVLVEETAAIHALSPSELLPYAIRIAARCVGAEPSETWMLERPRRLRCPQLGARSVGPKRRWPAHSERDRAGSSFPWVVRDESSRFSAASPARCRAAAPWPAGLSSRFFSRSTPRAFPWRFLPSAFPSCPARRSTRAFRCSSCSSRGRIGQPDPTHPWLLQCAGGRRDSGPRQQRSPPGPRVRCRGSRPGDRDLRFARGAAMTGRTIATPQGLASHGDRPLPSRVQIDAVVESASMPSRASTRSWGAGSGDATA